MTTWRRTLIIILVLALVAAIGYIAGVVRTVRVMCEAEQRARAGAQSREAEVPILIPGCDSCRQNFPDWLCWMAGCP